MKIKAKKSVALKRNFKKLISILLPIAKKVISNQINQIKSRIMRKIRPNKIQNTPKRVSNRGIKSLENNFSVKATKNIINTPKIVIEKSPIVAKPNVLTSSKITTKPEVEEYKKRVIKQLKKHFKKLFDAKKK